MSELNYDIDEAESGDGKLVIKFGGSINPSTVERFQEGMDKVLKTGVDGNCQHIHVSFRELTYINSSGLRVILTTTKTAMTNKISFKFIELDDEIYKIFEQVGYCRIFDINKL